MNLYPLKFKPIPQYRIWGGNKLKSIVSENLDYDQIGEIWSISGVDGNVSVVANGELKGKNLKEIISEFGEELLGKNVFEKFGTEFPVLIKFIDTADKLSVQVHPNDKQARKLHNSFGKSEMWYIIGAESDAELVIGLKEGVDAEVYKNRLNEEKLEKILNYIPVQTGDAVYIPAGRVHAICAGILLAEIQQTSDLTYRIYDYNRIDKDGKKRELHTELALKAIDFNPIKEIKTNYDKTENQFNKLIESPYFKTRIFKGNQAIVVNQNQEMQIFICTQGKTTVKTKDTEVKLRAFESLIIPAGMCEFQIIPEETSIIVEVKAD